MNLPVTNKYQCNYKTYIHIAVLNILTAVTLSVRPSAEIKKTDVLIQIMQEEKKNTPKHYQILTDLNSVNQTGKQQQELSSSSNSASVS